MRQEDTKILRAALNRYGIKRQIAKLNEEFHELGVLLSHAAEGRGGDRRHIAEEIADCRIMLDQMEIFFAVKDECSRQRSYKLNRLEKRLTKNGG